MSEREANRRSIRGPRVRVVSAFSLLEKAMHVAQCSFGLRQGVAATDGFGLTAGQLFHDTVPNHGVESNALEVEL